MNTIRELKQQEKYKNMLKRKSDQIDIFLLALIFGLFGCILIIFGFILLITTPSKQPKGMSMNDCLEAVGDYKLCERKLTNGR